MIECAPLKHNTVVRSIDFLEHRILNPSHRICYSQRAQVVWNLLIYADEECFLIRRQAEFVLIYWHHLSDSVHRLHNLVILVHYHPVSSREAKQLYSLEHA